jgi:hypothetical protein
VSLLGYGCSRFVSRNGTILKSLLYSGQPLQAE